MKPRAFMRLPKAQTMSTPTQDPETLPPIDGIEQLAEPIEGARPFTKIYYRGMAAKLVAEVEALPVRENHFIAPAKGWPKRIYRRATK